MTTLQVPETHKMSQFKVPKGYKIKTTNEDGTVLLEPVDLIPEFWDGYKVEVKKALEFFKVLENFIRFKESKTDFDKFVMAIPKNQMKEFEIIIALINHDKLSFGTLIYLMEFETFRLRIAEKISKNSTYIYSTIIAAKKCICFDDLEAVKLFKDIDAAYYISYAVKNNSHLVLDWLLSKSLDSSKTHIAKAICESRYSNEETKKVIKKFIDDNFVQLKLAVEFKLLLESANWDSEVIWAIQNYNMPI